MGKAANLITLEEKYDKWFSPTPEVDSVYGPDPLLMRKTGRKKTRTGAKVYKERLADPDYMDHAIDKIAQELSHFMLK